MAVAERIHHDRSLGRLLKDLSTEIVTLLRQEIDLAKTEMKEKIAHVATMGRAAAIGGGLAFAGALGLLAALILGAVSLLSKAMSPWVAMWVAPLLVGLVLAGVGYAMLRNALKTHRQSLVPHKTAESLQENQQWLKSKIQ
jgi:uncharacterized membrane protein YqjE